MSEKPRMSDKIKIKYIMFDVLKRLENNVPTIPLPPDDPINDEAQREAKDLLFDLCEVEDGLTEWEMNFIDDVGGYGGPFSERQIETIKKIHARVIR